MSAMRENAEAQRWQKELRQHDRKLLANIVTVLVVYFAGLLVVCYFSLDRSMHAIEQDLLKSSHWTD